MDAPTASPPDEIPTGASPGVLHALAQARAFGYLGPGPLQVHLDHSHGFGDAVAAAHRVAGVHALPGAAAMRKHTDATEPPGVVVDLGSGGGIPGLVLADRWPESTWTFVDSHQRRMGTLREVISSLNWGDRCEVITDRAEVLARRSDLRGTCDLVVARGFGGPAVTAECAAGFLRVGGVLVVSEPPDGPDRWSDAGLSKLGLRRLPIPTGNFRFFAAVQDHLCPAKYPRPVGIPAKTPLF